MRKMLVVLTCGMVMSCSLAGCSTHQSGAWTGDKARSDTAALFDLKRHQARWLTIRCQRQNEQRAGVSGPRTWIECRNWANSVVPR